MPLGGPPPPSVMNDLGFSMYKNNNKEGQGARKWVKAWQVRGPAAGTTGSNPGAVRLTVNDCQAGCRPANLLTLVLGCSRCIASSTWGEHEAGQAGEVLPQRPEGQ